MSFGDVYEPDDQPREKKKERTKTPVLNSFGRDLTKLAKENKFDYLFLFVSIFIIFVYP